MSKATDTRSESHPQNHHNSDQKQMNLFDLLRIYTPRERFLRFHNENRAVYRVLEEAAARHVARYGVIETSIDYLVHFARFERIIGTTAEGIDGDYKINNSFTAWYARLLLDRHPEWDGLFSLRRAVADDDTSWLREAA